MNLKEYMLLRTGSKRMNCLTAIEMRVFGIENKKGWPKRCKNLEITDEMGAEIANAIRYSTSLYGKFKMNLIRRFLPQDTDIFDSCKWKACREAVFTRDGYSCSYCGVIEDVMHIDHKLPRSLYKHLQYDLENLQVLCQTCNCSKNNKVKTRYLEELAHKL